MRLELELQHRDVPADHALEHDPASVGVTADPSKGTPGLRACDAVDREPRPALEGADGAGRLGAREPVDVARVGTARRQRRLERGDIGARGGRGRRRGRQGQRGAGDGRPRTPPTRKAHDACFGAYRRDPPILSRCLNPLYLFSCLVWIYTEIG